MPLDINIANQRRLITSSMSRMEGKVHVRVRWQPAGVSWMELEPVKASQAACCASFHSSPMLVNPDSLPTSMYGPALTLCIQ